MGLTIKIQDYNFKIIGKKSEKSIQSLTREKIVRFVVFLFFYSASHISPEEKYKTKDDDPSTR
jgi:hypothetical protein